MSVHFNSSACVNALHAVALHREHCKIWSKEQKRGVAIEESLSLSPSVLYSNCESKHLTKLIVPFIARFPRSFGVEQINTRRVYRLPETTMVSVQLCFNYREISRLRRW